MIIADAPRHNPLVLGRRTGTGMVLAPARAAGGDLAILGHGGSWLIASTFGQLT
jgi:hypothetical protein